MTDFSTATVRVDVPATSANLGPGFDCFGLALSRFDQVTAQVIDDGVQVAFTGEGSETLPRDERHLIVRAMRATFDELGGQPSGLHIESVNNIPHGRGLGSSAAAIVAGVQLARALVPDSGQRFTDADALALASAVEGHPDNVAACLLGGLTIAWLADGGAQAVRLDPVEVLPAVFIPATESSTAAARGALPTKVAHGDAAFNVARAAMLIAALTGRPELLLAATEDRLHQQYRAASMPGSTELLARLRDDGLAAVISGAGSAVLVLARSPEQLSQAQRLTPEGWQYQSLAVASGATTRRV